jgi:hypothetical protein
MPSTLATTSRATAAVYTFESLGGVIDIMKLPVQIATEQIKPEETQRALGIIPNFYVSYEGDNARDARSPPTLFACAGPKPDRIWARCCDPQLQGVGRSGLPGAHRRLPGQRAQNVTRQTPSGEGNFTKFPSGSGCLIIFERPTIRARTLRVMQCRAPPSLEARNRSGTLYSVSQCSTVATTSDLETPEWLDLMPL